MSGYSSAERARHSGGSHSVAVSDRVFTELIPVAEQEDRNVEELVNEALQRYLWEAKERQIDREMEVYRALHAELKPRYLGQYVAIHNGKMVGHNADRQTLSQQVRRKYGSAAVLITRVEEAPEREFVVRNPRFERGE